MKNQQGLEIVLKRVIYVLLVLLFLAAIWIINNKIKLNFNYDLLNPVSTFTGALLGALITGGLAIYINKQETNRIKEKEENDSTKTAKFINHYASLMIFEHDILVESWRQMESIPHPWDDVEFTKDAEGNDYPKWFPPQEEEKEYSIQIAPYKQGIRDAAKNYINYCNKLMELKVDNLDIESLDQYLETVIKLQVTILPVIKDISESENSKIDIEDMNRMREIIEGLTLM